MTINEEIKVLNEKAKELNNKRMQALGAKEVAEANYKRALQEYADKYGVVLTEANFAAEYDTNVAKLNESVAKLKQQIEDIESGKYKEKVELAEVKNESTTAETATVGETAEVGVVQPKRRGRPPKATVEAPVEMVKVNETEEMPFDGGVPIQTVQPTIQPTVVQPAIVQPVVQQPVIQPTVVQPTVVQPTIQPTVQPTVVQPAIQPMVQPVVQSVIQPTVQTAPTVNPAPTVQIKPMEMPHIVDDEEDIEDEDVPPLSWSLPTNDMPVSGIYTGPATGGVSLNDFKGFQL